MASYGETYQMNFGYNPNDSMTYVSVEVNLAFGYGMQWLKPQGIMKRWGTYNRNTSYEVSKKRR